MVTPHHLCGRCASQQIRKNGSNGGSAKYQCTSCVHQDYFQLAAPARAARYAQVEKLLVERVSQRAIVRLTGVSRMTVAKLAKKAQVTPLRCPPPRRPRVLELDKMWTFVGRKRRKVWRWPAVERYTRSIVAWVLGTCGTATARLLWKALPAEYRTGT